MDNFKVKGEVKRFPGPNGWYYVELDREMSESLRPLLKGLWPALIKANFKVGRTSWQSSIMPIKNGALFIALPLKVRKPENINAGDQAEIQFKLI